MRAAVHEVPRLSVRQRAARRRWLIALFLSPFLALILLFFITPAIITIALGFTSLDMSFQGGFVGLTNFRGWLSDPLLPRVLSNTVVYVFSTAVFSLSLGLLLALLTTHVSERVGSVFRALWLLPRLTPIVVYALLWLWILDPTSYGLLNNARARLGLPPVDLISASPRLVIVLVSGLIGASLGMVILTSAIRSIPVEYIRAARVDGASSLSVVRYITLPLIRWPLAFVLVFQGLSLLTSYDDILLVTGGGPFYDSTVYALYIFRRAFQSGRYGYGAALAVVLVIAGAVAATISWRLLNFKQMLAAPKIEAD
jgi:inositol-phosphate transport system permease protein